MGAQSYVVFRFLQMISIVFVIMSNSFSSVIDSPIGNISICASEIGVTSIQIDRRFESSENEWSKAGATQLTEYFNGDRKKFDLEYDFTGGTDFRISVWKELLKIPFGSTCSYMDIAQALNNPGSIRAVGSANGANPLGIIIPCHRVIGSDGSLTGYANGLEMKRWLLEFEGAIRPKLQMTLF